MDPQTFRLRQFWICGCSSVKTFRLAFPTGWDIETFQDKETEVPSLSRDKGTTGQAQNLAKGQDGPGQPKFGTGRAGTAKTRDGTRDKTGQSSKGRSRTGK